MQFTQLFAPGQIAERRLVGGMIRESMAAVRARTEALSDGMPHSVAKAELAAIDEQYEQVGRQFFARMLLDAEYEAVTIVPGGSAFAHASEAVAEHARTATDLLHGLGSRPDDAGRLVLDMPAQTRTALLEAMRGVENGFARSARAL